MLCYMYTACFVSYWQFLCRLTLYYTTKTFI